MYFMSPNFEVANCTPRCARRHRCRSGDAVNQALLGPLALTEQTAQLTSRATRQAPKPGAV